MTDVAAPVFKKRTKNANIRKRPATPPPDQSASDSDYTDDEAGVRIKRRKKEGVSASTVAPKRARDLNKSTAFAADRTTNIIANEDATKASNWYTDAALAAKDAPTTTQITKTETVVSDATDGRYQGTAKYSNFIQKNPDASSKQVGPVKAPTNVRAITVTDFAPDVCKDYKQTGFCGFGDSCKFLHAREDYKQGWQLDKEWENVGRKDKSGNTSKGDEDMDEEEKMLQQIPFACIICKESYKSPMVTKCGHYFCEKCATNRYMKEKKKTCAACGTDTGGSFGVARKLKDLLEKKRKREEERAARADNERQDRED
ncbi:Pre-mRNA-splicing factor cwc24 [Lecanosticta acicola]|uniref:Pre-mRNA-splicing factor CWC24 n=1 Tax=Lecanosticta acicola TaxID=111012 RepID=A0AAI8Z790_9PEZI|nr:Pre-mRNA-splicing factor cwc24 [Lecanosticta acicola]